MYVRNSLLLGLVAGTAVFAMSACGNQDPAPAGAPAGPATTPTSPAAAPHTAAAATTAVAAPPAAATGCPVSASTLQKVSGLDDGYKLDSSSIKCQQNWAISGVTAPSVEQQGDGVIAFKYSATTGKWTKKGEGSDLTCGG